MVANRLCMGVYFCMDCARRVFAIDRDHIGEDLDFPAKPAARLRAQGCLRQVLRFLVVVGAGATFLQFQ